MASDIEAGMTAPDFTLPGDGGESFSLASLRGRSNVVVYFYPKDDTPGCTTEALGFRDAIGAFEETGTVIIGVSRDSVKRHDNFKAKYGLPFTLVSDSEGETCVAYGVWKEKKNYGRTYMGIERSTFLIDRDGVVRRVWHKVRVKGHVDEVLEAVREL